MKHITVLMSIFLALMLSIQGCGEKKEKGNIETQIKETSEFSDDLIGKLSDENHKNVLKAIKELTKSARHKTLEDRKPIVEQLGKLYDNLSPGLIEHLDVGKVLGKNPFIRWNIAIALGEIGHESAIPVLEKMLTTPYEHSNVKFRAILSLGLIGSEKAIPIIEKLVDDKYHISGSYINRQFVAIALGKIGHESGVPVLALLIEDIDPVVRWHVAVAFGDIGHVSGVEHLAKLLNDEIPFVRAHTAIALAQIGDKGGLPYLEQLVNDKNPKVAKISSQSLTTLKSIINQD